MARYAVDTLIKTLRSNKGLTQAQLAEGICTRETVSRIERGEHMPDWFTFSEIVKRLGEDPYRYYHAVATKSDMRMEELTEEIMGYMRRGETDNMARLVEEMEADSMFNLNQYRVKLLYFKAMYLNNVRVNMQEQAYEVLIESFKLVRPDFDPEKIDTYILTYSEMASVNALALIYIRMNEQAKGIAILKRLRTSMEKGYMDEHSKKTLYLAALFNIANHTKNAGQYNECLEACEVGLPLAMYYNDISLIVKFLAKKASCLLQMKRNEEGLATYIQAGHLLIGLGMADQVENLARECEEASGTKLVLPQFDPAHPNRAEISL